MQQSDEHLLSRCSGEQQDKAQNNDFHVDLGSRISINKELDLTNVKAAMVKTHQLVFGEPIRVSCAVETGIRTGLAKSA